MATSADPRLVGRRLGSVVAVGAVLVGGLVVAGRSGVGAPGSTSGRVPVPTVVYGTDLRHRLGETQVCGGYVAASCVRWWILQPGQSFVDIGPPPAGMGCRIGKAPVADERNGRWACATP